MDISAVQLSITKARLERVDFASPMSVYEFCYTSAGLTEVFPITTFLQPFDPVSWALIISGLVGVGSLLAKAEEKWTVTSVANGKFA